MIKEISQGNRAQLLLQDLQGRRTGGLFVERLKKTKDERLACWI